MDVKIKDGRSFDQFFSRLRDVGLLNDPSVKLYEDALIQPVVVHPRSVNPSQLYILEGQVQVQRDIQRCLAAEGVDAMDLDCVLTLENEDGEIWTYTPPLIEMAPRLVRFVPEEGELEYSDAERLMVPLVVDGNHRMFNALQQDSPVRAIQITPPLELLMKYPYYAHPNSWESVQLCDEVPELKKRYIVGDAYDLYRDLGPLGCGKPRRIGEKE